MVDFFPHTKDHETGILDPECDSKKQTVRVSVVPLSPVARLVYLNGR